MAYIKHSHKAEARCGCRVACGFFVSLLVLRVRQIDKMEPAALEGRLKWYIDLMQGPK